MNEAMMATNEGRLDLSESDRLPWLEGDDDYGTGDAGSGDTARLIGFAVLGLVVVAAIVAAIWWLGQRSSASAAVADGSLIEAPEGPYKVRPTDPGGKTFAGTGDESYRAGEGQDTPGRIATAAPTQAAAVPAETLSAAERAASTASATPAAVASAPAGTGVQVGAYLDKATAEAGWASLQRRYEVLQGVSHRVVEGQIDSGTVYRLQAVPGGAAAANELCRALKSSGAACQVK